MALKVAIVGSGMIANAGHIPAWKNLESKVEILGVQDRELEKAQNTAGRHGIAKSFGNLEEMLSEIEPDIVSVCTPNVSHASIAKTCLEAGAHVLCEKPLTTKVGDAKELYALAASRSLHLVAAQTYRFWAEIQAAYDIVQTGVLGEIYYAEVAVFRRRGIPKWGLFHIAEESAGGPLFDLGVHILDALNWIMGNPKAVAASGATYKKLGQVDETLVTSLADSGAPLGVFDPRPFDSKEFSVEDMGVGFIRYENGLTLMLRASWAANVPEGFGRTIIMGTKAGLALNPLAVIGSTGHYQSDTHPIVPPNPDIPFHGHWVLTEHMVKLVHGQEEVIVKPAEVINVLKALTALYESADSGREVIIS